MCTLGRASGLLNFGRLFIKGLTGFAGPEHIKADVGTDLELRVVAWLPQYSDAANSGVPHTDGLDCRRA